MTLSKVPIIFPTTAFFESRKFLQEPFFMGRLVDMIDRFMRLVERRHQFKNSTKLKKI